MKKFLKFVLGFTISLAIIVVIRVSIIALRGIYGYPMNLVIVIGTIIIISSFVLFISHSISVRTKNRLIAEGKWVEPKKEKIIVNEIETPMPNTKAILIIGIVTLILLLGFALYLIEL